MLEKEMTMMNVDEARADAAIRAAIKRGIRKLVREMGLKPLDVPTDATLEEIEDLWGRLNQVHTMLGGK
jgi:hypothetical protein